MSVRDYLPPTRVLVTGAAGQIGYWIVLETARGGVFRAGQPIDLVLLDIPSMSSVLDGIAMKLMDCTVPTLNSVKSVTNEEEAFKDIDDALFGQRHVSERRNGTKRPADGQRENFQK